MTMYRDYSGTPKSNPTRDELAARRAAYMALRPEPKPKAPPKPRKRQYKPRELKPKGRVLPIYLASECLNAERSCVHRRPGNSSLIPWCEWYGHDVPKGHKRSAECLHDAKAGLIDDIEKTEESE